MHIRKLMIKSLIAMTLLMLSGIAVMGQSDPNAEAWARTQMTSTVGGGTGLFNTLSPRALRRGEMTFSVFYNNMKRDPGALDINQVPVNLTFGLGSRVEAFINVDFFQQVTSRQPFLLSGPAFSQPLAAGFAPEAYFGPPVQIGDGAAFWPGAFAPFGGILPALSAPRPGTQILSSVDRPGYFPLTPFAPKVDFLDPTSPALDRIRQSSNGTGNITAGLKLVLNNPDEGWFGASLIPIVSIPSARKFSALVKGRGTGEVDWGVILAMSQEAFGHRLRFTENIGYVRKGDPDRNGVELLDLPDELRLNGGLAYAWTKNIETVTELVSTVFVGGRTKSFNPVHPVDYQTGIRLHFFEGRFSLGGAYRINLTRADTHRTPGFLFSGAPTTGSFVPITFTYASPGVSSYVAYMSFGSRRIEAAAPIAPVSQCPGGNCPPTVTCVAVPTSVTQGQGSQLITFTADVRDPENDLVTYSWRATGGAVVQGSGPTVTVDATGLAPGTYTVTVTVDDGKGNRVDCSSSFTVIQGRQNACPTVSLTADPSSVTEGDNTTITFHATASDPDGDPIDYQWSTNQGVLQGSGDTVTLNTAGLTGTIRVSVRTTDRPQYPGGPCSADASVSVPINSRPPIPTPSMVATCEFQRRNLTRVSNECKAFLDDVAARLQQDPRATVSIHGFADANERTNVALQRAERTRDYLVSKGVDPSRIRVVAKGSEPAPSQPGGHNRVVVVYFVPEGAAEPQE